MRDNREEQFLKAFEMYSDAIYRHCFFRLNNHDEAVDLTQEVFLRAWKKALSEDVRDWKALLYRIAHTKIIDIYRSAARQKNRSLDALIEEGFDKREEAKDVTAEISHILGVLKELDHDDREIIIMRYVDNLLPKEIAEVFGINENATSVRIHRALKKLKQILHI